MNTVKHSKWLLAKNIKELTDDDILQLITIYNQRQSLYETYIMKEQLRHILSTSRESIQAWIEAWIALHRDSELPQIRKLVEKIQRHAANIVNTIQTGQSNAQVEAFNNKIKLLIRKAYGFRNLDNFFDMIYLT